MGYPSDYANVPHRWLETVEIARSVGLSLPPDPSQDGINEVHRDFVRAFYSGKERTPNLFTLNNARTPNLFTLNNALHWHEHHLQNRGPSTTLDFNMTQWQCFSFPEGVRPEAARDGGLYLLYIHIGRWWEETWRAGDNSLPLNQHIQQSGWNLSCYLANHTLAEDVERETAVWNSRPNWGCVWAQRQSGLYRLGTRVSAMPEGWNNYPVARIKPL